MIYIILHVDHHSVLKLSVYGKVNMMPCIPILECTPDVLYTNVV